MCDTPRITSSSDTSPPSPSAAAPRTLTGTVPMYRIVSTIPTVCPSDCSSAAAVAFAVYAFGSVRARMNPSSNPKAFAPRAK